jgi:DNA replication protein DnaC
MMKRIFNMLIQPTIQKLKALKLFGMAQSIQSFIDNPQSNALSFDEKIGIIVDHEFIVRENKRQARLLKSAQLRTTQACVENIDYQHPRRLNKELMATLTQCDWVQRHQNLIFVGPTGIGKTYLTCALGQQACRQGLNVRYFRLSRLFETMKQIQAEGKYARFMKELLKADLLILDDWGLGQLSKNERHDLLEILEDRHALKSTAITSQLPVDLWHEYIGDATIADAILDRLLTNAHKLELKGPSMRIKGVELDPDRSLEVKC